MKEKKEYSGFFIIVPEQQETVDEIKNLIKGIITENSGQIIKETMIGKKTLTYPIKKKKDGIFYDVDFTADPGDLIKMTKQFRININILRVLIDKKKTDKKNKQTA